MIEGTRYCVSNITAIESKLQRHYLHLLYNVDVCLLARMISEGLARDMSALHPF